jgi:uncharacterized protein
LVIERPEGKLWAVEVKRSLSTKPARGFHQAIQDLEPERSFVIHASADGFPVAEGVEAIGVRELATPKP